MTILCSISTRGRYDTTLPLAVMAVINQTTRPDKLIIFDDNDQPEDIRNRQLYLYLFNMLDIKGIQWEVRFGQKKGQHFNHQVANTMGFDFVWRVDDDCAPEPNVLENLMNYMAEGVGAVGGAILTPPLMGADYAASSTGKIGDIGNEPNLQWNFIKDMKQVDHLHCSFVYRARVVDYNLNLSRVAHREETLFTYGLRQKGYSVMVVPDANTWHLKNKHGGIRMEAAPLFEKDEDIFRKTLALPNDATIVVLDCGMGDHIVFSHDVLPRLKNPVVFSCYNDIVPGRSIQEAKDLYGGIEKYDIYRWMDMNRWTRSLAEAYRKMYGVVND